MLKSFIGFTWILFAILIALKILHVFKKLFLCQKNVHPILDFLTRRGKSILSFLDFYLFFYEFFRGAYLKKLRAARPGRSPAEPPARPRRLLPQHDAAAAESVVSTGPHRSLPPPPSRAPPLHK